MFGLCSSARSRRFNVITERQLAHTAMLTVVKLALRQLRCDRLLTSESVIENIENASQHYWQRAEGKVGQTNDTPPP
jgi:hypothetical protein